MQGDMTSTINVGGVAVASAISRTADGQIGQNPTLAAGIAGTLSTRTDDNTGVITLGASHGVTTADFVDVFWSGGVHYGMAVTATDATTITVDIGAGDNLPAQDTVVVVGVRQEIDVDFGGDDVEMIAASSDKRAHIEFLTAADASIEAVELLANEAWSWATNTGVTNPLAANTVGKVQASCGEAAAAALKLGVLYDSTP